MNIFLLKNVNNYFLRLLAHLIMLPIVAGVSYEVLMGLAHSNSKAAHILRWPGLQMQRLTTREPDASMLECAIVSVNVVLNGLPPHAEKTPEGWAILHDYRESEKGYVPPVKEEEQEKPAEGTAETNAKSSDPGETAEAAAGLDSVDEPETNAEVSKRDEADAKEAKRE